MGSTEIEAPARASTGEGDVNPWLMATLVLPAVTALALSTAYGLPVSDWPIAVEAGNYLLEGNLDVYAEQPGAQMGPLAFLLAALLPRWLYSPFVIGLLVVFLLLLVRARPDYRVGRAFLAGAMLLAWPWAALGVQGHGDDAIVLVGLAVMVFSQARGHAPGPVAGFLLAVAAKPTAVLFLPLLLLQSRRALAAGMLGGAVIWAPFVLIDPAGFLAATRGHSDVLAGSLQALMGIEPMSGYPWWVRPAQFGLGLAACWWIGARSGWAAGILAAVTLRTLLEPAPWNYYSASLIAVALMYELSRRARLPVVSTLAFTTYLLANPYFKPMPDWVGFLRIAAMVAILVAVVVPALRRRQASDRVTA